VQQCQKNIKIEFQHSILSAICLLRFMLCNSPLPKDIPTIIKIGTKKNDEGFRRGKEFRETKQKGQKPGLPSHVIFQQYILFPYSLVLILIFLSTGSTTMCPLFLTTFGTNSPSFLTHVTLPFPSRTTLSSRLS